MAQRGIPNKISPYVWGYLSLLEKQGVPIQAAYLFGSWAKGTQHKNSDIDICVVSPTFRSWEQKVRTLGNAQYEDFLVIEPHGYHPKDFKPSENPVAQEILKHGIRLI